MIMSYLKSRHSVRTLSLILSSCKGTRTTFIRFDASQMCLLLFRAAERERIPWDVRLFRPRFRKLRESSFLIIIRGDNVFENIKENTVNNSIITKLITERKKKRMKEKNKFNGHEKTRLQSRVNYVARCVHRGVSAAKSSSSSQSSS